MDALWPLAWLTVTSLVFAAPLLPAWRELRGRHDAAPLAVDDITDWPLAEELGRPEEWPLLTTQPDATDGLSSLHTHRPALAGRLRGATTLRSPLQVRALYCDDSVTLLDGAVVTDALLASQVICAGQVVLPARVQAQHSITLASGCRFFRLQAPRIGPAGSVFQARPAVSQTRLQSFGALRLRSGEILDRDCVVQGDVILEAQSVLIGNVKAHGRVILADGAQVHGHVFALGAIQIGSHAFVAGHVISQQKLQAGPYSQLGTEAHPATCSAPQIRLSEHARVHGTASASGVGVVR